MNAHQAMREAIVAFCATAGKDPLLVQGAGGNVSWKDGDTLWIKASGTWLADAAEKDIFVPVDLAALRTALAAGDYGVTPVVRGDSALRPSIETVLHALMPHQVVVHVHAIDVLAHLVQQDWRAAVEAKVGAQLAWTAAGYRKPGAELAAAVAAALGERTADVVFLENHGVVVGGASVADVEATIAALRRMLHLDPRPACDGAAPAPLGGGQGARLAPLPAGPVHCLARDPALFARLADAWALYPDHVVFLGAQAPAYASEADLAGAGNEAALPEFAIVAGAGVYAQPSFGLAKQIQLQCYHDVLARLPAGAAVNTLALEQIGALLNWESEKYRMRLAK